MPALNALDRVMSGFPALNVEPEEDTAEEVDDTREIQLEEAFKLYQTALRLHSLGSESLAEASNAYKELFESEIFKYPEAISDFARDQLDEAHEVLVVADHVLSQLANLPSSTAQASPSSLPQIIHLSFKNYGQFLLEEYAQDYPLEGLSELRNHSTARRLYLVCSDALKQFAEALERDDTDLELWRKAATVAHNCASDRIVRFCLESVLAGDDEGSNEVVDILGLDEALAVGQLQELISSLQDDLSAVQTAGNEPRGDLLETLKKTIEPFPFLPVPIGACHYPSDRESLPFRPKRYIVSASARSWLGVGQALLHSLNDEYQIHSDTGPGAAVFLEVPANDAKKETKSRYDRANQFRPDGKTVKAATGPDGADGIVMGSDGHPPALLDDLKALGEVEKVRNGSLPTLRAADGAASPSLLGAPQNSVDERKEEKHEMPNSETAAPSRKRSATSAGHDEVAESGRSKSKRLRNRESNADVQWHGEENACIQAKYHEDQLNDLALADDWLFKTGTQILSKLGVNQLGSMEDLCRDVRDITSLEDVPCSESSADARAMSDLWSAITSWSDEKADAVTYGFESSRFGGGKAGLALFLEHSRTAVPNPDSILPFTLRSDVSEFVGHCNHGWYSCHQIALQWLEALILPWVGTNSTGIMAEFESSSYRKSLWPDELKLVVVQLITREDDHIYYAMQQRLDDLEHRVLKNDQLLPAGYTLHDVAATDMALTLYELHLDIYSQITNPSSQVDSNTRILQHDRLERWSQMAGSFINIYADHADEVPVQYWHVVRFIWTATTHAKMTHEISQEHVMLCLQDLQRLLRTAGSPVIALPNNAALPEISVSAVEKEISRISTLDFFQSISNDDFKDPVAIIENLEPILEPANLSQPTSPAARLENDGLRSISTRMNQLIDFLESGDASLKLFLWRRLRDAYIAIDYPPRVVSCYFGSIDAILSELSSRRHIRLPPQKRELALLKWVKELDDIIAKLVHTTSAGSTAFEVVDERHLQNAMSNIARISRILHSVALHEDSVRVGQAQEPKGKNASCTKSLDKFRDKLRDMHVRAWTLQYNLLKEGILQNGDQFDSPDDDRAEYLQSVHSSLGLRGYCKHSTKMFLRLLKSELMTLNTKEDYRGEMAQVLYDLHQLKFTLGIGDSNHDCPPEPLDKKSAAHILETVIYQARRMNIKDLLKSELKTTMDKIQHALGPPKSAAALSYNRRSINSFLKSAVNQLQLYRASRGEGSLSVRVVETESAKIAAHGWYFLLGHLSLAKFKSSKRTNQGPTDDLDIATTFLKQDLEHDITNWESWFRLAQTYDVKIEEDLLWTADKVNNHRQDLAILQRNAIHSYEMSMAMSVRFADDTAETACKISEMYTGFAFRLYASSREPLSMEALDNKYQLRHYSSSNEQSTLYQGPSTPSISIFSVWRFSAHLLRRALVEKPRSWINHYMLGKCLWKMLTNPEPQSRREVQVAEVCDAFIKAIKCLPKRKDNRADHILEPHFKLVSVVHKLVHRKMLSAVEGSDALQATRWARDVHLAEDDEGWEPYILEILKKLGHADKANWHHRIIARSAHVIYDYQQDMTAALGAKHKFTQQIFTKTMTLQVWKPEYERAGRHFVYTSRYVLFFVKLLNQVDDRTSMDQLVRRIRRKPGEYLNHQQVWEQVVTSYVGLLRRLVKAQNGLEESLFRTMDHEEFINIAGKLERHANDVDTSNIVLDILRDAIELKKLNNSLMKGTLIDDLIVDCYASLYQSFVATLPPEQELMGADSTTVLLGSVPGDGNRERMKLGSILTGQADGSMESSASAGIGTHQAAAGMQAASPSTMPALPAKPARPKVVSRREVQRKAEGLVPRPAPIKTPTLLKHTTLPRRPSVIVEIPPSSTMHAEPTSGAGIPPAPVGLGLGAVEGSRLASIVRRDAADGVPSANSSRPGSVHDSADDESELSELEDGDDNTLEDDGAEELPDESGQNGRRPASMSTGVPPRLPAKLEEEELNDDSSVAISDSESARNDRLEAIDIDEKSDKSVDGDEDGEVITVI